MESSQPSPLLAFLCSRCCLKTIPGGVGEVHLICHILEVEVEVEAGARGGGEETRAETGLIQV